jgi:hypothetical protein
MMDLTETLRSLQDTDVALGKLNGLVPEAGADTILAINLEALAKRRADLERRLGAHLRADQLDLVEYRIDAAGAEACPAIAVAQAVQRFQELTTAVFDAVRSSPKRLYQPSRDSVELSTMGVASARAGAVMMVSLSVPNDRLLAIQSDLDVSFELVFALLRVRSQGELLPLQSRVGVAALTRALAWADNSIAFGLTTFISWQKNAAVSESIEISPDEATALHAAIESTTLERVDDFEQECELLSLNNASSTFLLITAAGDEITGLLASEFPRGPWPIHARYLATLTRRLRVRCSTGEETVRWTLGALAPLG